MDPNTTLRDLREAIAAARDNRHHIATVRTAAADAADHAGDLVEWLDRGGFLPNDWQPFNAAGGHVANPSHLTTTLGAISDALANGDDMPDGDAAAAREIALARSILLGAERRESSLQADYDRQRDELAAFSKSLGDCNTDRCNLAIATAKANRERDQAIKARDAALSMARDEGHQAGRRIDALTRDLDHTREELVEAHEAAGLLASHLAATKHERDVAERDRQFAQSEADQLRDDLAAVLSTLEGRVEEEAAVPADRHQRDAWALLAREAASIARMGAMVAGDHRSVKVAADLHQRRTGDDFAQLAAMLAVGAARYASRRRDPDTASRTADHLDHLADRIAPATSPEETS